MVVGDVDTVGTFNWAAWKSSMERCCSSLRWALGADGCSAAICNGRWGLRSHSSVSWALLLGLPAVSYALLSWQILGQMDNEAAINQTELQLSIRDHEEEVEEEEESDSWGRKESKTVFNTDSGISSPFLPTDDMSCCVGCMTCRAPGVPGGSLWGHKCSRLGRFWIRC